MLAAMMMLKFHGPVKTEWAVAVACSDFVRRVSFTATSNQKYHNCQCADSIEYPARPNAS
jgi:hypothetical protein